MVVNVNRNTCFLFVLLVGAEGYGLGHDCFVGFYDSRMHNSNEK